LAISLSTYYDHLLRLPLASGHTRRPEVGAATHGRRRGGVARGDRADMGGLGAVRRNHGVQPGRHAGRRGSGEGCAGPRLQSQTQVRQASSRCPPRSPLPLCRGGLRGASSARLVVDVSLGRGRGRAPAVAWGLTEAVATASSPCDPLARERTEPWGFQRGLFFESSRASPPHRPLEDGLTHPTDTSRSNLASALGAYKVAAFPNNPVAHPSPPASPLSPPAGSPSCTAPPTRSRSTRCCGSCRLAGGRCPRCTCWDEKTPSTHPSWASAWPAASRPQGWGLACEC
jgi:hypothetical protein